VASPTFGSVAVISRREPLALGRRLCISLLAASIVCAPSFAFAQAYFTGLGDMASGTTWRLVDDISADGSTVIGRRLSGSSGEFYRWGEVAGVVGTGVDPVFAHVPQRSLASSGDGSVVVGSIEVGDDTEAFVWDEATGIGLLGSLPGGLDISYGFGISGDGTIVAGDSYTEAGPEGFVWDATNGMRSIGELPGGVHGSSVNAVSADGSTIVGYSRSGIGEEAFIWDESNGMQPLGHLMALGSLGIVVVSRFRRPR
jgi:uncharacterized membrane protein